MASELLWSQDQVTELLQFHAVRLPFFCDFKFWGYDETKSIACSKRSICLPARVSSALCCAGWRYELPCSRTSDTVTRHVDTVTHQQATMQP